MSIARTFARCTVNNYKIIHNGFFDWNCCVKFFSVVESGMGATLNAGKPKKGSIVAVFGLGVVGLAVSTNNKCPLYVPLYAY